MIFLSLNRYLFIHHLNSIERVTCLIEHSLGCGPVQDFSELIAYSYAGQLGEVTKTDNSDYCHKTCANYRSGTVPFLGFVSLIREMVKVNTILLSCPISL